MIISGRWLNSKAQLTYRLRYNIFVLPRTLSLSDMFKDSPLLFLFLFSRILPADNAQWFRLEHNGWLLSGKWGFIFQSLSRQQKQQFERRGGGVAVVLIKVVSCFFFPLCQFGSPSLRLHLFSTFQWSSVHHVEPSVCCYTIPDYLKDKSGGLACTFKPHWITRGLQRWKWWKPIAWNRGQGHPALKLPNRDNRHLLFLHMKMGIFSWPWKPPRKICSLPV